MMNKLTRYKRTQIEGLNELFYPFITQEDTKAWEFYRDTLNLIKNSKKLPQKQYITNLNVCNID